MSLAHALGELLLDVETHAGEAAPGEPAGIAPGDLLPRATPGEQVAAAMPGGKRTAAAVLVPLYADGGGDLRVVLTKRRSDLRRHAGEISFPGGRQDPLDANLAETALREAEEEIGLAREDATVVGALERTSTFATNYTIQPFVALLTDQGSWESPIGGEPAARTWRPSALEVESVIEPTLVSMRSARGRTTIERRGFVFETDAYLFDGQVVWGATARIVAELLDRVGGLLDRRASS